MITKEKIKKQFNTSELLKVINEHLDLNKEDSNLVSYYNKLVKNSNEQEFDLKKIISEVENSKDIEDIMKINATKDDGGIIAMSGFYFQLLVTIDYLIELLKGKWTNIIIDHHQDIIVFNDKTVRFIQVKTKNVDYVPISETEAYRNWIPKLLMMQTIFDGYDVELEFELVTNFRLINSKKTGTNIEHYRHNANFSSGATDGDLADQIIKYMENVPGSITKEKISNSLKSFKTTVKNIEGIETRICCDIGELFYKEGRASIDTIDYIVGNLFKKCFYPDNISIQIVNLEEGESIREQLRKKVEDHIQNTVIETHSKEIVGAFIEEIKEEYQTINFKKEFYDEVERFNNELSDHFINSEKETIYSLLSRFSEKKVGSEKFRPGKKDTITMEAKRLFKLMLFIKLYFGGQIDINEEHNKLLIANIGDDELNFYGVKNTLEIKKVVEEFKTLFYGLEIGEQLQIIYNPKFKVILSGEYDNDDFLNIREIEVGAKETPDIKNISLNQNLEINSIAKVENKIKIIDAYDGNITNIHTRRNKYKNLEDMKNRIKGELKL